LYDIAFATLELERHWSECFSQGVRGVEYIALLAGFPVLKFRVKVKGQNGVAFRLLLYNWTTYFE